jgi:hypothetical protein
MTAIKALHLEDGYYWVKTRSGETLILERRGTVWYRTGDDEQWSASPDMYRVLGPVAPWVDPGAATQ